MRGNSSGNAPATIRGKGVGSALLRQARNGDDRFPPLR